MKACTRCGVEKPLTDFYRRKAAADGHQSWCKACAQTNRKKWMKDQGTKHLEYNLRASYGMTSEEYDELLGKQGGVCAICGEAETIPTNQYGLMRLAVDHCHATDRVRGLLCAACNRGLGMFKDDPSRLRAAAEYLS